MPPSLTPRTRQRNAILSRSKCRIEKKNEDPEQDWSM
ncbi:hypothetical protein CCACVL1_15890 [Corchorus capsularis]|uniref:Uncharacterized protein n=1 Tax=Corchorus capsularis TaxID=210143 RepID=A0A1R3I0R9_COCAP|nr:hypothetical protein CCACVL1_15890 [Corchorus capsularis]